jgi:hypothetical protein
VTIHLRPLLVAAAMVFLLWLALGVRWAGAIAAATVALDVLSFANAIRIGR